MDSFGTTRTSYFEHNSNSLDYLISDIKDSVEFVIGQSCSFEVNTNVNDHTSRTNNHESNIQEDENPLGRVSGPAIKKIDRYII